MSLKKLKIKTSIFYISFFLISLIIGLFVNAFIAIAFYFSFIFIYNKFILNSLDSETIKQLEELQKNSRHNDYETDNSIVNSSTLGSYIK